MMEENHGMKTEVKEENHGMKTEENHGMKTEVKDENHGMKTEENHGMKTEVKEENHEMKIEEEENHEMKIEEEENHEMKIEEEENHEMKIEEEENHEMKIEEEENYEMKTEVKQEKNEEIKVEQHQNQEPDLHPLNTTNRTDPAASSGPSDLQVEKMAQKRKSPALRNEDTDEVVKKRLIYDPSGPWPSTSSQEAESTDLQICDTATMIGAASALLGIKSVSVAPSTVWPRHSLRTKKKKIPTLVELRLKVRYYKRLLSKIRSKVKIACQVITVTALFIQRIPISGRRSTYYRWKSMELLETCRLLLDEICKLAKLPN